mgnify:CR=1 FL=1
MSANITEHMLLSDLLKATGYNCPANLQGKTFKEATAGGSPSELDDNKAVTIDASTYTQPVEVTPTEGKEGMKKCTVTLENIPQAGATLYAWKCNNVIAETTSWVYLDTDKSPVAESFSTITTKQLEANGAGGSFQKQVIADAYPPEGTTYIRDSDTQFTIDASGSQYVYTKQTGKDITLW